ncbi:hypothetical protein G9A89_011188 [Geosiphon pyriformis]|nr:hypothetical protein G9A89_011188 [Geosiphon pyriformis]
MIDVKKTSGMQWEIYVKKTNQLTNKAQRKLVDNSNDNLNLMWLTIKETVLQTANCLPKKKVGAQSAHTKKEDIDHKLVKIVADIIKQIRDKLITELLSIKKKYRLTLHARIRLQQQKQIVDNIIRRQQNFDLNKGAIIKSILNKKKQRVVLNYIIEKSEFYDDPDEIKKLVNKKAQG